MSKVYFISGGNRGMGFELVKLLSDRSGTTVIASSRNPSKSEQLKKLTASHSNVHMVELDVTVESSVEKAATETAKLVDHIDVLILNAAISQAFSTVLDLPTEVWEAHWRVNVLGPVLCYKYFYSLVRKSETKQIVFISSSAGSISDFVQFYTSAYGQSKAALNYTMKEISSELDSQGFTVISLHPGGVMTDMGAAAKDKILEIYPQFSNFVTNLLKPEESAVQQLKIIDNLSRESNGKFLSYDGTELAF